VKINKFIKKLQKLPERTRRVILWSVVILIGLILAILWILNINRVIKNIKKEDLKKELNLEKLEENLQELSEIELPEEAKEQFEEIGKDIEKIGEEMEKLEEEKNIKEESEL